MNAPNRRSTMSAAVFAAVAIGVAMLVQLILSLVLNAPISMWGLLSVDLRDTADASTIGLGFDVVKTLLLWALLTAFGSLRWRGGRSGDGHGDHPAGAGTPAGADGTPAGTATR